MSGGSFNYLCHKDAGELLSGQGLSDLENMAEDLLNWCPEAAKLTEELRVMLRVAELHVQTRMDVLNDLWHAVEWYRSADYGEDQVKEAVKLFRAKQLWESSHEGK